MSNWIDVFKLVNEIYEVRRMSVAERILFRKKKDLISYIAIHFWSFIKTLLIAGVLLIVILYPDVINIRGFWIYLLIGLIFLIFDSIGIRALIFIFKRFFVHLFQSIKRICLSVKDYFLNASIDCKKYKGLQKGIRWGLYIVIFPILLPFIIIYLIFTISLYMILFLFITILNNEALSLMISINISKLLPLENKVVFYAFIAFSLFIIYFLVDYRVRVTEKSLVIAESLDYNFEIIKGKELKASTDIFSLYIVENKYYLVDISKKLITIYDTKSKYKEKRLKLEEWFNKRQKKRENKLDKENVLVEKE